MELLGARVIPVASGTRTLKDAINAAMRDWVANIRDTHYLLGSCVGPHPPFPPRIVRDFQSVIGEEARRQILEREGRLPPEMVVACVGGGSNAIGIFYPFVNDDVRLVGVEAGGEGLDSGRHGGFALGRLGRGLSGGALLPPPGRRRPGARDALRRRGPRPPFRRAGARHAEGFRAGPLRGGHRREALHAFRRLSRTEGGIIPALESAHAVAYALRAADDLDKDDILVVNLSGGRGGTRTSPTSRTFTGGRRMSRIEALFARKNPVFIGFTVAGGDPGIERRLGGWRRR